MRTNGPPILWLTQLTSYSRPVVGTVHFSRLPAHECHIHRTICHHARRAIVHPRVSISATSSEIRRGAKTQATVKLQDLPQGVIKLDTYDDGVDDAPRYPTVVQGHRNNMQKFKNCVILTRVGGFYEVSKVDMQRHKHRSQS